MTRAIHRRAAGLLCAAVLIASALPVHAQTTEGLGLAERRAIAAYKADRFPMILAEIRAAAKTDLDVDVQWEKIAVPGQAAQYGDPGYWTDIYFRPLTGALSGITADAMGRDALKAKLKKVLITFDAATAPASNYPNGLTFADGTLTINFKPYSNAADVADRQASIQKLLENNL